jgi:hypothetical protein
VPAAPLAAPGSAGIAQVVDRFLASKMKSAPAAMPNLPAAAPPPPMPAPEIKIADFVCENDVREAIQASRKIYVGPKTIVTPSAREVGDQHGILVMTGHR